MVILKNQSYEDYKRKTAAKPKKDTKPTTSVTVVTITEPAIAGSCLSFLKTIGTKTPAITELIKLITMATEIKIDKMEF